MDDEFAIDLDILNQTLHPNYTGDASYYDVAILETPALNFSRSISPICLPETSNENILKYENYYADLIGWGQEDLHGVTSNNLKRVTLKIYPLR